MEGHKDLKKLITDNNLISSVDYLIACGSTGWTDLRFTNLIHKLTNESHYGIALMLEDKPVIFQYEKLKDLHDEIKEDFIINKNCLGYDFKNNRVHVHYEGDNIFRFGNKLGKKIFKKEFQICTLKDLAKRNNYKEFINLLSSDEKHRAIQVLLAELGIKLGFNIKLARNDENLILKSNPTLDLNRKFIKMEDINLNNIKLKIIKDSIDLLDIVWCEPISNTPIAVFEVEFQKNYSKLFTRYSCFSYTEYSPLMIVVGDDYINYSRMLNHPTWKNIFKDKPIGYMTLNKLSYILQHIRHYWNTFDTESLYKFIFNEYNISFFNLNK